MQIYWIQELVKFNLGSTQHATYTRFPVYWVQLAETKTVQYKSTAMSNEGYNVQFSFKDLFMIFMDFVKL